MGFIKGLGEFLGEAAGTVVGKSVKWVGEKTEIKIIEDIGEGAYQATKRTGRLLGQAVSGTVDSVTGLIQNDEKKYKEGLTDIKNAGAETYNGIEQGVKGVYHNGTQVVQGIAEKDFDKALNGTKGLAKTVGVGVLAVGILDFADGLDGVTEAVSLSTVEDGLSMEESPGTAAVETNSVENPNTHHVTPHWRQLGDGQVVWVDGIPNPDIHGTDGWEQHNPNYHSSNSEENSSQSHVDTFLRASLRSKEGEA